MDNEKESTNRYRPLMRILAVVLTVCILLSTYLSIMTQVRYEQIQYVNTILELASNITAENTGYLTASRVDRAITFLKTLIRKPHTYEQFEQFASLYIAREDYANAIDYMQKGLDVYNPDDVQGVAQLNLRIGCLYVLTVKYKEAISYFDEAIRLMPDLADAYVLRAQMTYELGDTEGAIADMNRYAELSGDSPAIQSSLGLLYESIGDLTHAHECYTVAIDTQETPDADLYYSRARCCTLLEDTEGACRDLEQYFTLGGTDEDGSAAAMLCYYRGSGGDYAGALEMGDRAIKKGYSDPASVYSQCVLYAYCAEDYTAAVGYARSAIELGINDAEMYQWAAVCEMSLGEYDTAAKDFQSAMLANPRLTDARYNLAVCLMAQEKYVEAKYWYTASIDAQENITASLYARGVCCFMTDDEVNGTADLLEVIERNDDDEIVAEAKALLYGS